MDVRDLPAVNASLNATATALLAYGYYLIRRKQVQRHQYTMIAAFAVSVIFLICYLVYHYNVGSVPYPKDKPYRGLYLFILLTHIVLAAAVPFLAIASLALGWTKNYRKHRQISKWTWPVWMYVSVTGVIVYLMLYQF